MSPGTMTLLAVISLLLALGSTAVTLVAILKTRARRRQLSRAVPVTEADRDLPPGIWIGEIEDPTDPGSGERFWVELNERVNEGGYAEYDHAHTAALIFADRITQWMLDRQIRMERQTKIAQRRMSRMRQLVRAARGGPGRGRVS